jgi:ABC-type Fe3+/spermidine/putrescine transport system ATPase subunit
VRPETLRVDTLGDGSATAANGRRQVEGVVESSLYLGTSTQIAVDLGEGVRMTVLVPNASEVDRQRLPGGGARVALSWDPRNMSLVRESPQNGSSGEAEASPERAQENPELETPQRG